MLSNINIETKNKTFLSTSQKNIHEILFFIKIPQAKEDDIDRNFHIK